MHRREKYYIAILNMISVILFGNCKQNFKYQFDQGKIIVYSIFEIRFKNCIDLLQVLSVNNI